MPLPPSVALVLVRHLDDPGVVVAGPASQYGLPGRDEGVTSGQPLLWHRTLRKDRCPVRSLQVERCPVAWILRRLNGEPGWPAQAEYRRLNQPKGVVRAVRSEEHTSELQSP